MKAHLMYADRDAPEVTALADHVEAVRADLDLDTLVAAMAAGDAFLEPVALAALASPVPDAAGVTYRQQVLADCLANPQPVREIYELAGATMDASRQIWRSVFSDYPEAVLRHALETLRLYIDALGRLRGLAEANAPRFASPAFTGLFAMLAEQLGDAYLDELRAHARTLEFRRGVPISAALGTGLKGTSYTLDSPRERRAWRPNIGGRPARYTVTVPDRDESGARTLAALRGHGIESAAGVLARSTEHIGSFWSMLRTEIGFYVGCLNLWDRTGPLGLPLCVPLPAGEPGEPAWRSDGLYDICLALRTGGPVVASDVDADGTLLTVITGANRGGKSTLLRAAGLAQLMMQAGMPVPATAMRAAPSSGVFTHFKREEDAGMDAGKLDEELRRMSALADHLGPGAVVLLNESFAATNEREGSAIARNVIDALLDAGVRVFCVTHLYELAAGLRRDRPGALFLRAERGEGGVRPFTLVPGEPLPTSFGEDVYRRVFGRSA